MAFLLVVRASPFYSIRGLIRSVAERSADQPVVRNQRKLQSQVQSANFLQALSDVLPVDDLPEGLHPIPLHVLVLQIVGVLPHVEYEKGHGAVADIALVRSEERRVGKECR